MARDIDDPDLTLAELFRACPGAVRPFLRHGTACIGCLIAPFHTVRDTCAEYRLDEARFLAEVRAACAPSAARRRSARRGDADRSP
jgi:hybrid cluster-associated redox disulfide protein